MPDLIHKMWFRVLVTSGSKRSEQRSNPVASCQEDNVPAILFDELCNMVSIGDTSTSVYPGATDYDNDGIDQDCDGSDYTVGVCQDSCVYAMDSWCDDGGPWAITSWLDTLEMYPGGMPCARRGPLDCTAVAFCSPACVGYRVSSA